MKVQINLLHGRPRYIYDINPDNGVCAYDYNAYEGVWMKDKPLPHVLIWHFVGDPESWLRYATCLRCKNVIKTGWR